MTATEEPREVQPVQRTAFAVTATGAAILAVVLFGESLKQGLLLLIGLGLGIALYHAAFGFTGAYRRALVDKDISGIVAQVVMFAAAMMLFAPVLSAGEAFGRPVVGAVAPVSVSMMLGALIFGIGMQLGGGCASGTLYTAGGGSPRMALVLAFFCVGAFWGSLDLGWWQRLPSAGAISLAEEIGWGLAIPAQLAALGVIYLVLRRSGASVKRSLWWHGKPSLSSLVRGPWPLLFTALVLAALNFATLVVAQHPWSVTWAFSLWAAKAAVALGWDPATSAFWSAAFQSRALAQPVLSDTVSIMNFGIILGAMAAAALAGRFSPQWRIAPASLVAAIIGGLLMGYGARLAYGCNIGAFFSGIASTSLHGWAWIVAAIIGNVVGVKLRPVFGMDGFRAKAAAGSR